MNECTVSKGFLVLSPLVQFHSKQLANKLSLYLILTLPWVGVPKLRGQKGDRDSIVKRRTKTPLALLFCFYFIVLLQSPKTFGDINKSSLSCEIEKCDLDIQASFE